jgi:aspartate aminotransferase
MTAPYLSSRVLSSEISPNAAASQRAKALKASGVDVLDLTIGEPDFETPDAVKEAAYAAMNRGETRYTPSLGTNALREAIVRKLARENQLSVSSKRIAVANGGKQVIYNAFAATLNPGSEVIIPAPYYPSFPEMVKLNAGTPVFVPTRAEDGYKMSMSALEAAITPDTRWIVINTPSNPSGAVYHEQDLLELAAVLRRHPQVLLLLDEVYEHIMFIDPPRHFLILAPDLVERVLSVNAVSKTYAMTGWRIGYGHGPEPLIKAMAIIQSQSTSGASSIGQAAALAALDGDQSLVAERNAAYRRRRDLLVAGLSQTEGLTLSIPDGGLFVFANCDAWIGRHTGGAVLLGNDAAIVDALLEQVHVACVPGSAYGAPGHLRFSIAVHEQVIERAVTQLQAFARTLQV